MAWVEKDHNDHRVSTPPRYMQGCQPPDQAAQSHIQPGPECLQGWGIHSLLGQPVTPFQIAAWSCFSAAKTSSSCPGGRHRAGRRDWLVGDVCHQTRHRQLQVSGGGRGCSHWTSSWTPPTVLLCQRRHQAGNGPEAETPLARRVWADSCISAELAVRLGLMLANGGIFLSNPTSLATFPGLRSVMSETY